MFDPTPQVVGVPATAPDLSDRVTLNLIAARALIADPANWCTGVLRIRRDARVQRCAVGAIDDTIEDDWGIRIEMMQRLTRASRLLHPEPLLLGYSPDSSPACRVPNHNNILGHASTLAMFDLAIKLGAAATAT